ncbi:dihydrolipoyl dehydrogenase [Simkania negevensis]|uniref:Dihydrolipoyl dehydrogenase n=1 Tax=Simkania negevensis TaxID=83561 RepID=A0ABS3AQ82_9BACT|nr:dihydrolipoyl dehydrogenase [Simkania negevensis]
MTKKYDIAIIGAGPAGYVAAIRAAQLGLKVCCIEKGSCLGGTCLNVGCIPSKTMLHATERYAFLKEEGADHGILCDGLHFDLAALVQRKNSVVKTLTQGIAGLFKKNGIDSIVGKATLLTTGMVEVEGQERVSAKQIVLATGSLPIPLPFLPFDEKVVLSSTGALSLKKIPKKMIVVGAGVIGLELGSVYKRIGTEVTVVEFLDRICPTLDMTMAKTLMQALKKQGMLFHFASKVVDGEVKKNKAVLRVEEKSGKKFALEADALLVAIGRKPYTNGLGLEKIGVELDQAGRVVVDENFRTTAPGVYAIGDLIDGPMLAHKGEEEGIAVVELIAGNNPHINYLTIPSVVYTYPEVAAVGLTEEEARERGIEVKVGSFPFKANSRARCTGEDTGQVKVIVEATNEVVVGMHIAGPMASEMIMEGVFAIGKKMTARELAHTCHPHPNFCEAVKEAALAVNKSAIHI